MDVVRNVKVVKSEPVDENEEEKRQEGITETGKASIVIGVVRVFKSEPVEANEEIGTEKGQQQTEEAPAKKEQSHHELPDIMKVVKNEPADAGCGEKAVPSIPCATPSQHENTAPVAHPERHKRGKSKGPAPELLTTLKIAKMEDVDFGQAVKEHDGKEMPEDLRVARACAEELARLLGSELEEDAHRVRIAGIHPAFLSASRSESNPYQSLIDRAVKWNLLSKTANDDSLAKFACLWAVLSPIVSSYGDGLSPSAQWKKKEIRDIGARFWLRPTEMRIVNLLLSRGGDSVESVCRRFVSDLSHKAALSLVVEERDNLSRVHFLSFPVELFGASVFVKKNRLYSMFVRSLCDGGMLPPWVEFMYLLAGKTAQEKKMASRWRAALVHVVARKIVPHLRADYLSKESSVFLSHAGDADKVASQRRRLRVYLHGLWSMVGVTVNEQCHSQYALSFRARKASGHSVWPADASPLTEDTMNNEKDEDLADTDCAEMASSCDVTPDMSHPLHLFLHPPSPPPPLHLLPPPPPPPPMSTAQPAPIQHYPFSQFLSYGVGMQPMLPMAPTTFTAHPPALPLPTAVFMNYPITSDVMAVSAEPAYPFMPNTLPSHLTPSPLSFGFGPASGQGQ